MKNATVMLETRNGRRIEVVNKSADVYRLNQMRDRGFITAGELCCRLGIPLIGGEQTELKITDIRN